MVFLYLNFYLDIRTQILVKHRLFKKRRKNIGFPFQSTVGKTISVSITRNYLKCWLRMASCPQKTFRCSLVSLALEKMKRRVKRCIRGTCNQQQVVTLFPFLKNTYREIYDFFTLSTEAQSLGLLCLIVFVAVIYLLYSTNTRIKLTFHRKVISFNSNLLRK